MAVAYALVEMGSRSAAALALLPVIAVGAVYLVTSGQFVLYGAAVAASMTLLPALGSPVFKFLYFQDLVAGLALGALIFARFLGRGQVPPSPRTPVLGLPLVLFGAAIVAATVRGHYEYEVGLFGQPLRLVFYAAIVAGLAGMTAPRMHRLLQILFYPGAVYIALVAVYFLATGGSASDQDDLSTGGTRVLNITTSLYCAGALFLALLNLRSGLGSRSRFLHLAVAAVALFGVVVGFGRAVYAAVAVVGLLLLFSSSRLRGSILTVVPLALPFLVLLAIGVNQAAPELRATVADRLFSSPETDTNVQWRVEANRAVLEQVREQPLVGVGFGRESEFFLERESPSSGLPVFHRVEIGQDPHNGFMFLLAGGGVVTLGAFLLLLGTFAADALKRYRSNADPHSRLIILWACAFLFAFLVNAASGTTFSVPEHILTIWALLVLPSIVRPAHEDVRELPRAGASTEDAVSEAEFRDVMRPAW